MLFFFFQKSVKYIYDEPVPSLFAAECSYDY